VSEPAAPLVLFVCHANTARSVMAHLLLERMLAARGAHVRVRSAGVAPWARDGMLPSLDARIVLRDEGIALAEDAVTSTDLRRHPELLREARVILTMTAEQRELVRGLPDVNGCPIHTLAEFAGTEGDIADPAMRGEEAFRAALAEIKRYLAVSIDRLAALSISGSGTSPGASAR
jgi:protein-tyrosine-phosphatase